LQSLGHVDYVKNLPVETQRTLNESSIQNFIPWRAVWKENSVSTLCRVVFDASQATSSGYSFNDLLANGKNNINKLQNKEDWCYQRYIWQENLDPTCVPEQKIIKTLIYGVKSSGNQAEHAIRETAKLSKDKFPEIHDIILNDV